MDVDDFYLFQACMDHAPFQKWSDVHHPLNWLETCLRVALVVIKVADHIRFDILLSHTVARRETGTRVAEY